MATCTASLLGRYFDLPLPLRNPTVGAKRSCTHSMVAGVDVIPKASSSLTALQALWHNLLRPVGFWYGVPFDPSGLKTGGLELQPSVRIQGCTRWSATRRRVGLRQSRQSLRHNNERWYRDL